MTPIAALLAALTVAALTVGNLTVGNLTVANPTVANPTVDTVPAGLPAPVGHAGRPAPPPAPRLAWRWPLAPRPVVVRGFSVGPDPWSPGHRGADLAGRAGQAVLAPGPGTVSFRGVVAGMPVVVLRHAAGLRTTYQPVVSEAGVGTPVARGDPVGSLVAAGSHCAPGSCLHWGALRGGAYLDPLTLLPGGSRPVVLLPLGR